MLHILIYAESRYPVERRLIRQKVGQVLLSHGISDEAELGITFVGDRKMTLLNKKHMKRVGTTDVLSFPLINGDKKEAGLPAGLSADKAGKARFILPPDNILRLGDIVVSYPQARRQASEQNRTVDEEVNVLVEHGILHLLGIHHD